MEPKGLKLPNSVVSRFDVARLLRELDGLNDFFVGAARRQAGAPMTPPRLSRTLDQLAKDNHCNLLEEAQRRSLQAALEQLSKQAPQLHISFAADPQPAALDKILVWFRTNIHPQALVQVGLQPNIAAGCVLRTPNKVFDMSLRSRLEQQKPYLAQLIAGAANGK